MNKLNMNKIGIVLGILSIIFFLICSIYGSFFTSEDLKTLHYQFLQLAYPGFTYTLSGYFIGIVESFIYGWFTGALFVWLHAMICIDEKCNNK